MLTIKTYIAPSELQGNGLFAAEAVKKGAIVHIHEPDFEKEFTVPQYNAMTERQKLFLDTYAVYENGTYTIDIDEAKYINHSDTPNVQFNEEHGVALKDMYIGEEITCDYKHLEGEVYLVS